VFMLVCNAEFCGFVVSGRYEFLLRLVCFGGLDLFWCFVVSC